MSTENLSSAEIARVHRMFDAGESKQDIADYFGVSLATVSNALKYVSHNGIMLDKSLLDEMVAAVENANSKEFVRPKGERIQDNRPKRQIESTVDDAISATIAGFIGLGDYK